MAVPSVEICGGPEMCVVVPTTVGNSGAAPSSHSLKREATDRLPETDSDEHLSGDTGPTSGTDSTTQNQHCNGLGSTHLAKLPSTPDANNAAPLNSSARACTADGAATPVEFKGTDFGVRPFPPAAVTPPVQSTAAARRSARYAAAEAATTVGFEEHDNVGHTAVIHSPAAAATSTCALDSAVDWWRSVAGPLSATFVTLAQIG